MGKTGQTDQCVVFGRFGIHQHLAGKSGAKFRNAKGSGLPDDGIILRQTQDFRGKEDLHRFLLSQFDLLGIHSGHILQHADHRRIIVTQFIQFQQVGFHTVVFKMGGDDITVFVVCRMLYRTEIRDIQILRNDDQSAGMLGSGPLDANQSGSQTVFLRLGYLHIPFLEIVEHISVRRLLSDGPDGTGTEHVVRPEQDLCIFMGFSLIFTGEVQIDIRCLFISWESKERLKGNIESFLAHGGAAFGADLVRHIRAAVIASVGNELGMLTVGTQIMRRQGVYFRDIRHICHD